MRNFSALRIFFIVLVIGLFSASGIGAQDRLNVLATTTIIADVARSIGGDLVDVDALVPPNADVHAFEPAPTDAARLAAADVVLVSGAGLEAFLGSLLRNAAGPEPVIVSHGVPVLAFGAHEGDHTNADSSESAQDNAHTRPEMIGLLGVDADCEENDHEDGEAEAEHEHSACDPHVWTDPTNVMIWADNIAAAFAAADPANAEVYTANAAAYKAQLAALDAEIMALVETLPEERRVLVTNHEFMGYFAAHYGFELVGVVISGGSTLSEPDPRSLAALSEVIHAEGVPAIFAEISANPQLAEVVASETGAAVVTTIYSDSLSEADGPASTYLEYLRYNAEVIVSALSAQP